MQGGLKTKAGWIARDENGINIGSGQATGRKFRSALESEFQALIIAMQNAWCKGYKRIIFEGDNQEMINLLNGTTLIFEVFNWLREVRFWENKFDEIKFSWIPRSLNHPTDILVKSDIPNNVYFYYHFYIPYVIFHALHCNHIRLPY